MDKLVVEREEQSSGIWTTLLQPCAGNVELQGVAVKETAFSKAVGYGWRYGLARATNRGNHSPCRCSGKGKGWNIVVDLVDTSSPNLNFGIDFSCCLINSKHLIKKKSKNNAETMSPVSALQSTNCRQISSEQRGQFGFCHEIGSFCNIGKGDCILVTARISGDLASAQRVSGSPIKAATAVTENPAMPSVKLELANALEQSLSSGTLIDIRFNVFSCQRKVGRGRRLCRPLPLYAVSTALNHLNLNPGDLGDVSNIGRMTLRDILSASNVERSFLDVGDEYEEDSDVDPDEESIIEEVAEKLSKADGSEMTASTDSPTSSKNTYDDVTAGIPPVSSTFVVTGPAYKTWKAFLFYAYTGQVEFSPLTSKLRKDKEITQPDQPANDTKTRCPPCSPKSMYRLAHKMQLEPLQRLALENIRRNLTKDNILQEVLSQFTAKYPEIRKMEMSFLMAHRGESGVMESLTEVTEQMMRGEVPHRKEAFTTIIMDLWKAS